jgi:hypothetical protein
MHDWRVSPRSGVAFLDLREGSVASDSVERLTQDLIAHYDHGEVALILVAVNGYRTTAADVLITALRSQAEARGLGFELHKQET